VKFTGRFYRVSPTGPSPIRNIAFLTKRNVPMNTDNTPHPRLLLQDYPAVEIGGRRVAVALKHGLALLALLGERRAALGRGALAALLWPDATAGVGRARLRRLVHELHAALGTAVIDATVDTLRLAPACAVDIDTTRAAMAATGRQAVLDHAALRTLAAPGAAGWLEGFTLGVEAFDDWAAAQRSAHQAALSRALETAAMQAFAQRDAGAAETAAAALLRLEPCNEAAHGARMAARALCRDAAGVETAYFECARQLREELGVRPSPAVEAAYAEALGQARAAPMRLAIAFAPTRHGQVAYADWGRGRETIVVLWGLMSNLEVALDEPRARAMLDALARQHRVVMIDRRGTGLSERVGVQPDAPSAAEDIAAVLDHLRIERAWLFGSSVGGTLAIDVALRQPRRTAGLLLWGTSPSGCWSPATPWGLSDEGLQLWADRLTEPRHYADSLQRFAPSVADDPWVRDWYARLLRNAGTRLGTVQMLQAYQALDLRARLAEVSVPTLVLQRRGDRVVPAAAGQMLASGIPGARLAMLEGDDHFLWHGDSDAVLDSVLRFLGSAGRPARRGAEGAALSRRALLV
jgi:pimeloyl-ACP methyl ester carboxylesterase/DNA-binding SARP family transcriptional activator